MIYDMKDYWANPKIGEKQVVQDVDRDGNLTKRAEYLWSGAVDGKPVIRLDEYNEGRGWTDAWEYRFDDRGVLEVADWETGGTHKVFKQGLELNWGNKLEVGQTVSNKVEIDFWKSRKVFPFFGVKGYMNIKLENAYKNFTNPSGLVFDDVIQIYSYQTLYRVMGFKTFGKTVWEVRRFHAKGIGVVVIDYMENGAVSGRHHAKSVETVKL